MGVDIHVKIIHRNTKGWEPIYLFYQREQKEEMEIVDPYPFRNSELFSILSRKEDDNFPCSPIFKEDLPESILTEINQAEEDFGYYGFCEVNLADLELYTLKHPTVKDFDAEWIDDKPVHKTNPVIYFMERIKSYIDLVEPFWDYRNIKSNIRILYWFDC